MKRLALFAASCIIAIPAYAQNVATVNGKAITQKQLDDFVSLLISQGAPDSPQLREQVKQEMIGRQVAVQAAEKAGIDKQAAVKQEIELARQSILVRALMADHLKKHPVTDADIQAEYDEIKKAQEGRQEYKLRHILVKDEQAAKDIIAAIKSKKTTFEAAAKKDSIDPGSGAKGGDLGWGPSSNYVPEFAQAVEKLKKGQMTDAPVQTQFGWHVIQVEDARPVSLPELKDVKTQIEEMLRQDKLGQFQQELMKSADVK
ncbi:peptidylprolyl isomerase [Pusillimonas noertemannii]|uniref:peptidylprolyl isomerase n=1 Tax=Pusillimonas noertemannii TaxID=305977 RepID=A0A2U1CSB2_9BURK|nr:peptidylprolyl isomerase [Pusillimonas noertemannii]NYT68036.1 peptidylprolyl isomerase [Pusillimonas noertemannii]PVY68714.1 peptidyl-prolyl cis-trans isomerase C [Pusillimonas noertemannii]TFL11829.1 peptidylprolyl isomerase [Pusillimonas noertemannii]